MDKSIVKIKENNYLPTNFILICIYIKSKKNIFDMRLFFFLFCGFFAGLYLSWPGLLKSENWKCFNDIIAKSTEDKIPLKAALEISPSYLLKGKNKKTSSKIRIVADACFR